MLSLPFHAQQQLVTASMMPVLTNPPSSPSFPSSPNVALLVWAIVSAENTFISGIDAEQAAMLVEISCFSHPSSWQLVCICTLITYAEPGVFDQSLLFGSLI